MQRSLTRSRDTPNFCQSSPAFSCQSSLHLDSAEKNWSSRPQTYCYFITFVSSAVPGCEEGLGPAALDIGRWSRGTPTISAVAAANTLMSFMVVFPSVLICQSDVRPYADAASPSDPVGAAGALTASKHTVTSTVSPSIGPPPASTGVSVRTPKSLRFSWITPSNPATSP